MTILSIFESIPKARLLAETTAVLENGVFGTTWQIWVSSFLCILLGALATSAGIGGGGLFVPLYAFVLGTGVKYGVPVSKATIFGGSLGKYLSTAFTKHPSANRPIVNYNLVAMMQSWELLGTIFGVFFNVLFPELVIVILLVLVLGFSAYKTLKKGIQQFKKESNAMKKEIKKSQSTVTLTNDSGSDTASQSEASQVDEETKAPMGDGSVDGEISGPASSVAPFDVEKDPAISPELQAELDLEAKLFPKWNLAVLAVMTVFIIFYSLIKKGIIGEMKGCTAGYWVWYFVPVPFFCLLGAFVVKMLRAEFRRKQAVGYEYQDKDLRWDDATIKKTPLVGFAAGVAASLVGIGGGMVTGPLFLELGLDPRVSSSTSAFMIVFTGMSSVVQYLSLGYLPVDFALWFMAMGFIGAQLGHHSVKKLLERSGRPSLICFLLGGIIAVSVLIMFINGIVSLASTPADELFEFSTTGMC